MLDLDRPLDPERDRWFLGTLDSFLATTDDTNGQYSVVMRIASKGFGPPPHIHSREDTGFLVLDGRLRIRVGDEEMILGPNDFRMAPRDVIHCFEVLSDKARFLEILSPGGFEAFHRDLSEPAQHFDVPPPDHPRPSWEEVAVVSRRHGTVVVDDKS